jgi:DNA-directed RNA polymerase subunit RPC12/RpoP
MQTRPPLTPEQARELYNRCFYCGARLLFGKKINECDPDRKTVDHVTARSIGGANKKHNKVLACFACNRRKKAMSLEAYRLAVYGKDSIEFFGETLLRQWGIALIGFPNSRCSLHSERIRCGVE